MVGQIQPFDYSQTGIPAIQQALLGYQAGQGMQMARGQDARAAQDQTFQQGLQTQGMDLAQQQFAADQAAKAQEQAMRQEAIAAAQRGQAAMVAFATNPNPTREDLDAAIAANPEQAMQVATWFKGLEADAQARELDASAKMIYALGTGNTELVTGMLTAERDAALAGGDKAGADQASAAMEILKTPGGKEALLTSGLAALGSMAPPELFSTVLEKVYPAQDLGTAKTAAEIAKLDAEAAKLKAETDALAKKPAVSETEKADLAERWNKTYYTRSGNHREASMAYSNITEAGKAGSGAGDVALITSFMKMLDPGSVVRETEFATARDTNGLYESLQSSLSKAQTGELLTPAARQNYLDLANKYMAAANKRDEAIRADIRPSIVAVGIPEELVFGVSAQGTPIVATATPPAAVTQPDVDPAWLKYLNEP